MLKAPTDGSPAAFQKWADFSAVIHKILDSKSHADLGALLRDPLQTYIPHEVLIAAWGNFHLGVIHYDFLATDPEAHAEGIEAGALAPVLAMLFQQWVVMGRKPMRVGVELLKELLPHSGLPEKAIISMAGMDTVLLHGIQDQRGSHDCLYAFFDRQTTEPLDADAALRIFLPFLDSAFRQIELPPPSAMASVPAPAESVETIASAIDNSTQLTDREAEIMRWVSLGKSNQEVGETLNLSSFTVKNHMQRIFLKLDVFNRAQAVSVYRSQYGSV
jgi:transcriptional regulator EpsA